jgi:hypothetical protein
MAKASDERFETVSSPISGSYNSGKLLDKREEKKINNQKSLPDNQDAPSLSQ